MSKTEEQRLTDAYREASRLVVGSTFQATSGGEPVSLRDVVERILEAADSVPPKWPADASLDFFLAADGTPLIPTAKDTPEDVRRTLRAAFLADPIIQAAVEFVRLSWWRPTMYSDDLRRAVRDAGLLDGTEGK